MILYTLTVESKTYDTVQEDLTCRNVKRKTISYNIRIFWHRTSNFKYESYDLRFKIQGI